jgi:hypothetical protein
MTPSTNETIKRMKRDFDICFTALEVSVKAEDRDLILENLAELDEIARTTRGAINVLRERFR